MITSFIQLLIVIFMVYICLYTIIDRICKCIEQSNISKAFKEINKGGNCKDFMDSLANLPTDNGK